jgi:hypothetical protein
MPSCCFVVFNFGTPRLAMSIWYCIQQRTNH